MRTLLNAKLFAAMFGVLFAVSAQAQNTNCIEEVNVPGSFVRLEVGAALDFPVVGGFRKLDRLVIKAEPLTSAPGSFEVKVNGTAKGNFVVNGKNDSLVTIGEVTNSIRIKHLWGGPINILNIKSYQSCVPVEDFNAGFQAEVNKVANPPHLLPVGNEAAWLASRAIRLVDSLRPYVTADADYVPYLLPIKTVAGRALAISNAEGNLSKGTREALNALAKQIVFAEPCIERAMKIDNAFDLAVEMVALKDEVERRQR